jgi:hypothetical protein
MHDIDRTQLEAGYGELGEFGETETAEVGLGELPLNEAQEMELASELLEVGNEYEFEQFLGKLYNTVSGQVGRFIKSDTGRALGGILKNAARDSLVTIGKGIGQRYSPARGAALGADAGRLAASVFGLELEGLSPEDKEFEVAKQFVRFAGAATGTATLAPTSSPPTDSARVAAAAAARTYAPGLLPRLQGRSTALWPRSGRWVRQGRTIVLHGG